MTYVVLLLMSIWSFLIAGGSIKNIRVASQFLFSSRAVGSEIVSAHPSSSSVPVETVDATEQTQAELRQRRTAADGQSNVTA